MKVFFSIKPSTWLFFVGLVVVCTSPVWGVGYFVNQDGSGHLHTASLIGQLLMDNSAVAEFYRFNSISVPNSSGHWVLLALLQFFSPFTVTKIFVTLSFAMFVAGAGWLRLQIAGQDGLKTSLLIGAAMGFNCLWLVGFYNFTIGVIGLMFVIGYFYPRCKRIEIIDTVLLSLMLTLAYFSHIIAFLALACSIFVIILFTPGLRKIRTLLFAAIALLPVVPLALRFRSVGEGSSGFSPVWRSLSDPYSVTSWLHQIRVVDPFIIISREAIPFVSQTSKAFAVFTPTIWLFIAFVCLSVTSLNYYRKTANSVKPHLAFFVLVTGSLLLAFFGPDNFDLNNGGVLRERLFIFGLLFCIPLFQWGASIWLKRIAQFCLLFIITFQTLALWEYALNSDKQAKVFLTASELLRKSPSSITITIREGDFRFHANPIPQLNCYNGIGTNNIVWDNYEFGHYLFPLITKNIEDRHFIHEFTRSEYLGLTDTVEAFGSFEEKLERINSSLESYNGRIETIVLWGGNDRVESVLNKWFEAEPYFENGNIRLFRHKK